MSAPRSSISSHRRSSSSSKDAAGASTPFPTTTVKFDYPVNANNLPTSPVRSSARETHEFAASLQRALRNIRGPFTLNKKPKTPPSILARKKGVNTTSSSLFSSGNNSYTSPKGSLGFGFDFHRKSEDLHRVGLAPKASCATFASRCSGDNY